jgi:hypothetical protein
MDTCSSDPKIGANLDARQRTRAVVAELGDPHPGHRAGRRDELVDWPGKMRGFARRERPHPGAQLTLLEASDGWRYTLQSANLPAATRGWRGQVGYIEGW